MLKQHKSNFIIFTLSGIVFMQNPPWFLWDNSFFYMTFLVFLLFGLCFDRIVNKTFLYSKQILLIFCLVFYFLIFASFGEFRFSSLVVILIFLLMFVVSEKEKKEVLRLITKILGVIIFISLIAWISHNYLYTLPMSGFLQYGTGKGDEGVNSLENYILFVQNKKESLNRFYSVFDEPGVLGTLSGFVLLANRYDLKKKINIIILLGGLFSFSLAFVFITVIGVLLLNLKSSIMLMKGLIIMLLLVVMTFFFFKDNETFQSVVIDRILNMNESGVDSRTSDMLNSVFENLLNSSDFFIGKGTSFFKENPLLFSGQGYKIFIIEYGIIGFALVLLMYLAIIKEQSKIGYVCLLIYLLSFLQRPFLFTPWQIILFSVTIANFTTLNSINKCENE